MGEPAKLSPLDAGMAKVKTYNPVNQLSNLYFKVLEWRSNTKSKPIK